METKTQEGLQTVCLMESIVRQQSDISMVGGMSQSCPFCPECNGHCYYETEKQ